MIIGSGLKDVGGTALLYRSEDFLNWRYLKPLLIGDRETSGTFWEMPIFVKLGDQHALVVTEVPGRSSYWVGKWKDENFHPKSSIPQRLELINHFLSPTPCLNEDGQVITMGIIPETRDPKELWHAGWAHLYSLPRVMSLDPAGRLQQEPLKAIRQWSESLFSTSKLPIAEGPPHFLENASGTCLEILMTFSKGESRSVSLLVRCSPDGREQTEIRYEWETGTIVLDRSRSSLDPLVKRDKQEAIYWPVQKGRITLNAFLDESVLEVFVDGRDAFASRIYPSLPASTGLAIGCIGKGAVAEVLSVARMKRIS
jgi:beta-fructofuranosidase